MSIKPIVVPIPVARTRTRNIPGKTESKCYHGAYPSGFLEAARVLLVRDDPGESIWHIPGGRARFYNEDGRASGMPLSGYGRYDVSVDINPDVQPDLVADVRDAGPMLEAIRSGQLPAPDAVIIDRDYSQAEAEKRNEISAAHWPSNLPALCDVGFQIVKPGRLVGVLDWEQPALDLKKYEQVYWCPLQQPARSKARLFTVWRAR